jgi:hypothetical protein
MPVELGSIVKSAMQLGQTIGKGLLSQKFPNCFEYYMCSFELCDYQDNTIDFFTFPIMPKSITKNENNRINVKKSASSVNVIGSKSFIPSEITLKGNFGRDFQILVGYKPVNFKAFKYSTSNNVFTIDDMDESKVSSKKIQFNPIVKTGYGCTKLLQSIINKSSASDDSGYPMKLYFYNQALGEAYLVVPAPNQCTFMQNETQNNMIWEYTINLIAIAPLGNDSPKLKTSLGILLKADYARKALNFVAQSATKVIRKGLKI